MKKTFAATALLLLPGAAFSQMTGTSHPEALSDTITTSPAQTSHYVKPSPAVPVPVQTTDVTTTATPVLIERTPAPAATPLETANTYRPEPTSASKYEEGVVMDVPSLPNELPAGTLIHTTLSTEISTVIGQRGDTFSVKLLNALSRQNEVLVPIGSVLSGRIAQIHAGNRLHGGPVIQLIPEYITLPDGTKHHIEAQVIDLPNASDAKVNSEGVIRGKDHIKQNAIGAGAMTGSATVAGAMIGGGVGAAVGAGIGAGVATVWWLRHEQEQTLLPNTEIVFSLDRPLLLAPTTTR